jgi:intergrase/recombinase
MDKYVEALLTLGVYKISGRQLYECSEEEVKQALMMAKAREETVRLSL